MLLHLGYWLCKKCWFLSMECNESVKILWFIMDQGNPPSISLHTDRQYTWNVEISVPKLLPSIFIGVSSFSFKNICALILITKKLIRNLKTITNQKHWPWAQDMTNYFRQYIWTKKSQGRVDKPKGVNLVINAINLA